MHFEPVNRITYALDEVVTGRKAQIVLTQNTKPVAVMLSPASFKALMNELEDLKDEAIAKERLQNFDPATAVTTEQLLARYRQ